MRLVHSPPPPSAAGEKPLGQSLDPSPPLTGRSGPAAPQRTSRRVLHRPATGRSTHKGEGGGRAVSLALHPRADNGGSPPEPAAAVAVRTRPRQAGGGGGAPVPRSSPPCHHQALPLGWRTTVATASPCGSDGLLSAVRGRQRSWQEGPEFIRGCRSRPPPPPGRAGPCQRDVPPRRPVHREIAGRGGQRNRSPAGSRRSWPAQPGALLGS